MARAKSTSESSPKKPRLRQIWAIFKMTRRADRPSSVDVAGLVGSVAVAVVAGLLFQNFLFVTLFTLPFALLLPLVVMTRRAERVAYAGIEGQPGASAAALRGLRRGWQVEEQPIAFDQRTQDCVFRAIGRPGVVLVTEGPTPRVTRLAEQERRRINRLLPNVPVHVVNSGNDEGQVKLRKLNSTLTRMRPSLNKTQVGEVSKRLRALGSARLPIPKGVDPMRARPDRRAMRGR